MRRYSQSFTRVLHLLLVVALLLTFAAPAFAEGGDGGREPFLPNMQKSSTENKGSEYLRFDEGELTLFFPDDFVPNEQMLQSKPDWIVLDDDGTLPAQVIVPAYVKIPRFIVLPERVVEIPDEKGDIQQISVPPSQIDLQTVLLTASPGLANEDVLSAATIHKVMSRRVNVYNVRVGPAFRGHCNKNRALGRVPANIMTRRLKGHSRLPTWVPTHKSVTHWGFHRPNRRTAKLCIPKSLYWIYIAPFSDSSTWWVLFSAYNYPRNWWFTY